MAVFSGFYDSPGPTPSGDMRRITPPLTLLTLKQQGYLCAVHAFQMDVYYNSFRFKIAPSWNRAKIVSGQTFQEDLSWTFFTRMRANNSADLPFRGRWYLSYFGGIELIQNKLQRNSHEEYSNDQYNNTDKISDSIENGKDLYGQDEVTCVIVELKDNDYLPVHYEMLMNLTSVP